MRLDVKVSLLVRLIWENKILSPSLETLVLYILLLHFYKKESCIYYHITTFKYGVCIYIMDFITLISDIIFRKNIQ